MATELPYFRFIVNKWQNGQISIEAYEIQGLFISICGYYWLRDCTVTLAMLQQKFSNATPQMFQKLIDLDILKHEKRHDKIQIDFLNIQFDLLSEKRKVRQAAGSKGGKAKAKLKQKPSYKDKENYKDKINSIEGRKLKFAHALEPFLDKYGREMLLNFNRYWNEPDKENKKLKFEMQKTWDLAGRLATWKSREKTFNKTDEKIELKSSDDLSKSVEGWNEA